MHGSRGLLRRRLRPHLPECSAISSLAIGQARDPAAAQQSTHPPGSRDLSARSGRVPSGAERAQTGLLVDSPPAARLRPSASRCKAAARQPPAPSDTPPESPPVPPGLYRNVNAPCSPRAGVLRRPHLRPASAWLNCRLHVPALHQHIPHVLGPLNLQRTPQSPTGYTPLGTTPESCQPSSSAPPPPHPPAADSNNRHMAARHR